jgi:anti-sigma factor RsiW
MAKPNPLAQGLDRVQKGAAPLPGPIANDQAPVAVKAVKPSRSGRVLIGGHFAPEVQTALKIVAAEERTTLQALLTEAIDTVLAKRGKPQIAGLSTN